MSTWSDSLVTAVRLLAFADPQLVSIVTRSLAVSASACAIGAVLGMLAGA